MKNYRDDKKLIIILIFLLGSLIGSAQDNTSLVRNQKGFLFLSAHNYLYDKTGGRIKPVGFHDYFFPCNFFDSRLLSDSNLSIVFKNGLRVESFSERNSLKLSSKMFEGSDSSNCYRNQQFYIIPVTLTYELNEDSWPFICEKNFLNLTIKTGANIRFSFLHKEIEVKKISSLAK